MKIIFLSDNFPPEVNAPATRTFEHCSEWVKKGIEVTVITCFPNFPQGKVYDGYKNKLYQKEKINGINVIRVWSFISPNKGFIRRTFDFISYAIMALIFGLFKKTDLIIATTPQFFTAISGYVLSFLKRKPWVIEVRDIYPEGLNTVGVLNKESISYKLLEFIEIHLYKSAKYVIVVTDSFKKNINSKGISNSKIAVFKNGVDFSKFKYQPKENEIIGRYNLNKKFIISYIGTHGMAHSLDFILECASEIRDKQVHFIFQGDGSEKESLMMKSKKLNLKNVTFLPLVGKDKIKSYISICDVALVNLKRSDAHKSVIPSKIFENARMQKPILLGVEGESKKIIEKYNAGVCFKPENKISFKKALKLIKMKKKYSIYKLGCRKMANDFNRKEIANNMLNYISN